MGRVANIVFKEKSENFVNCLTYALQQAIGLPRYRRSQLGGDHRIVCKIKSKFLNSRVLAGGFVIGCEKKSWC